MTILTNKLEASKLKYKTKSLPISRSKSKDNQLKNSYAQAAKKGIVSNESFRLKMK